MFFLTNQKYLKIIEIKMFKNHENDLSPKPPEPNMWLLVNQAKPTNTLYWN